MGVNITSGVVYGAAVDIDDKLFEEEVGDSELELCEGMKVIRLGTDSWTGGGDNKWLLILTESMQYDRDRCVCRPVDGYVINFAAVCKAMNKLSEYGVLQNNGWWNGHDMHNRFRLYRFMNVS